MAITQTGAIYKAFSFDNVSSRDYGVYITGEAVYNAPERDVEMISIPGRNGAFALDNGRFENIEVKYPAGIIADNETDFAQAVSDLRNYLCSKKGYLRLTDEYNPDEYRMAVYKSGLEVLPAQLKAGEFEIIFECKPQRWLTSGETAIEVADGQTILNPTLFDSCPLLTLAGYGVISFSGQTISVENKEIGDVIVSGATQNNKTSFTIPLDVDSVNTGDAITLSGLIAQWEVKKNSAPGIAGATLSSATNATGVVGVRTASTIACNLNLDDFVFYKGTDSSLTGQVQATIILTNADTKTATFTVQASYSQATETVTFTIDATGSTGFSVSSRKTKVPEIHADSTVSALAGLNYIDLEIGEAWNDNGGRITSLNNIVQLPAKLPTLKSGANVISFDDTFTSLKVTPRWWKV